jgi:cellulose biosynthesis protein BcsQ
MTLPEHVAPGRVDGQAHGRSRITVLAEEPSGASIPGPNHGVGREMGSGVERGRLLAVCGLCGGAGTSTLAYLVALAAAHGHPGSVLVADTGGPTGGLSCYAGVETPRSLAELSEHALAGGTTALAVATGSDGLRVLATGPRFTRACAREGIELLLDQARERYALTVIDCGTLARDADQIAMASASHVAWVLPATDSAVRRAHRVLDAATPQSLRQEMLVARHDGHTRRAPLKELRRLANDRGATLVLLPTVPDLATGDIAHALETAQVSLQAIHGVLTR